MGELPRNMGAGLTQNTVDQLLRGGYLGGSGAASSSALHAMSGPLPNLALHLTCYGQYSGRRVCSPAHHSSLSSSLCDIFLR